MIYGCIGEKLGHSFSKDIHNRLFDYDYELCEIPKGELDAFMQKRDFKAINVTIPYKLDVIPHLYKISETARKIGAVNTIINRDGKLYGYNTDFSGMTALIKKNGIDVKGKKALVLGSGGTSKTANAVLESLGASEIYTVSRSERQGFITYETANAVLESLGASEIYTVSRSERQGFITYETAKTMHSDAEIIVNTTPCGMYPNIGTSAIDVNDFPKLCAVVDAVYNPLRSKLVCDARKKGIPAIGGLYMLVAQAAAAAEKFIDTAVSEEKIEAVYRSLVLEKQNIVLVGMPGSGKSTIGKIIARDLGMNFIDSDEEIVKKAGKTIPEIFKEAGEEGFRKIESEVIAELSKLSHSVIATGGGAVLNAKNTDLLSENGKIYFIDRALSSLVATSDRPLSSSREDLERRYNERYDIYCACADVHLKCGDDAPKNAEKIKEDFKNEATCD